MEGFGELKLVIKDTNKKPTNLSELSKLLGKSAKRKPFKNISNRYSIKLERSSISSKNSQDKKPRQRSIKISRFCENLNKKSSFHTHSNFSLKKKKDFFFSNMKPSKVLLISNLCDIFISAKEIFNLFSCFGHIAKILLMKNLQKTMIEFKTI